jgi:hypothetical protein
MGYGADLFARIPNPDLATAVEVLSTGEPMTGMMVRTVEAALVRTLLANRSAEAIRPTASAHLRRDIEDSPEYQRPTCHSSRST